MEQQQLPDFECDVLPHLDAAYNLARWLLRSEQDTQDAVQEAVLRALRFFAGLRSRNARPWLMRIVRNICYTRLQDTRRLQDVVEFDEDLILPDWHAPNPESAVLQEESGALVRKAMTELPTNLREVLILRELEGMSYREIAEITGVPIGTVMSSLSRARGRLRQRLSGFMNGETGYAPSEPWL